MEKIKQNWVIRLHLFYDHSPTLFLPPVYRKGRHLRGEERRGTLNPDVAKNYIIQQTGMLEKLSSGHLDTLNRKIPSIL